MSISICLKNFNSCRNKKSIYIVMMKSLFIFNRFL